MTPLGALSGLNEAPELAGRRTIPFDYAFRYELTGKPGNVINKTVTVSIEGDLCRSFDWLRCRTKGDANHLRADDPTSRSFY